MVFLGLLVSRFSIIKSLEIVTICESTTFSLPSNFYKFESKLIKKIDEIEFGPLKCGFNGVKRNFKLSSGPYLLPSGKT